MFRGITWLLNYIFGGKPVWRILTFVQSSVPPRRFSTGRTRTSKVTTDVLELFFISYTCITFPRRGTGTDFAWRVKGLSRSFPNSKYTLFLSLLIKIRMPHTLSRGLLILTMCARFILMWITRALYTIIYSSSYRISQGLRFKRSTLFIGFKDISCVLYNNEAGIKKQNSNCNVVVHFILVVSHNYTDGCKLSGWCGQCNLNGIYLFWTDILNECASVHTCNYKLKSFPTLYRLVYIVQASLGLLEIACVLS